MTAYTDITVGRLTLRETFELAANISAGTDTRTIVLSGEESSPPLTFAQVKQRQEDILGLQNRLVPIRFGTKSDHDGWYKISDVNTSVRDYQNSELRAFTWGINAEFIGPENAVDLESRITGISRINDFGLTGQRWHGVPSGHTTYYTGTSKASGTTQRATADGASATVYRAIPASANPRWTIPLASYPVGRARVLLSGVERVGVGLNASATAWELNNGLVSASASVSGSATFNVAAWDGTQWDQKGWNFGFGSSASKVGTWDAGITVLRNDYEACTVRLVDAGFPGRRVLDLTLRRGARFIEGYAQSDESNIIAAWPSTAEAATSPASSGYVRATSNDAQGNRYVVGSARSFAALTASGGLSKSSTTRLDFFLGAEVGGSAAVTGDTASDLVAQYLTAMSEITVAALR
jgi:hypothetical protein